ncbi:hypothetical protein HGP16_02655 [Rhizobium sp. P40RR-XXII]|uniref:hypothetical protein n=1 Tax=unclassified Rhizobium TaxID=2613769 RepID=UPI0014577B40|nr:MULTISPECIES: hypothetical protein [unclassified Rhizobium]NLR83897.1 hypothetical protein [Rhizobium sp. P28RR-XV]NLS15457.1 hypothetical protein [Rhizobium sp. P40RR-XXII]
MKRMEVSSGSGTPAPLPLKKPAHIDDEAAIGKSTAVLKKFGLQPYAGRSYVRPAHLIKIGGIEAILRLKFWIERCHNPSLRFVDFP